jgi:hypothetical protein
MSQPDRKTFADFLTQQLQEITKPFTPENVEDTLENYKRMLSANSQFSYQGMTAGQAREMKMSAIPDEVPDHAQLFHEGVSHEVTAGDKEGVINVKLTFKNPQWVVNLTPEAP